MNITLEQAEAIIKAAKTKTTEIKTLIEKFRPIYAGISITKAD